MKAMWFRTGQLGVAFRLGLLFALPVTAGCGQQIPGKVSGRVLFNGKPLPGGYVMFLPADPKQNLVSVKLDEQGQFSVVLPVGNVRVGVDNRELEPRQPIHLSPSQLNLPPEVKKAVGAAKPAEPPPAAPGNSPAAKSNRYIKIPDKYYDADKSGLDFKVQSGDQTHDIELTG
jgi:hypothetical protein